MNWWLTGSSVGIYWIGLVIGTYLVGRFGIRTVQKNKYGEILSVEVGEEWYWAAVFWPVVVIAAIPGFVLLFPLWWAQKRAKEQRLMAKERRRKL